MMLLLINAGLPSGQSACLRTHAYPPFGIVHLATYLKSKLPDLSVVLVDDQMSPLAADLRLSDACLVGISANSISYPRAVEIAEGLKARGLHAPIVLGGIHATVLSRRILTNQSCFDYVVSGQGYEPLRQLLLNTPPAEVHDLWYREPSGEVRTTPPHFVSINDLPTPDFSLLPLAPYWASFKQHYTDKSYLRPLPFMSSTGCHWRVATGGCTFCSVPNLAYSRFSPQRFWQEVGALEHATNADFFWDISDTFSSDPRWLARLGALRPSSSRATFHVYVRAADLRRGDVASHLLRIGVREVLVGAESFDDGILRAINKGTTAGEILRALETISQAGIRIALSLILGLPGESGRSLRANLQACTRLKRVLPISEMHASILTPLPGSEVYREFLSDPEMAARYGSSDIISHEQILEDYLARFTQCSMDELVDAYLGIDNMFPSAGPFYLSLDSTFAGSLRYKGHV